MDFVAIVLWLIILLIGLAFTYMGILTFEIALMIIGYVGGFVLGAFLGFIVVADMIGFTSNLVANFVMALFGIFLGGGIVGAIGARLYPYIYRFKVIIAGFTIPFLAAVGIGIGFEPLLQFPPQITLGDIGAFLFLGIFFGLIGAYITWKIHQITIALFTAAMGSLIIGAEAVLLLAGLSYAGSFAVLIRNSIYLFSGVTILAFLSGFLFQLKLVLPIADEVIEEAREEMGEASGGADSESISSSGGSSSSGVMEETTPSWVEREEEEGDEVHDRGEGNVASGAVLTGTDEEDQEEETEEKAVWDEEEGVAKIQEQPIDAEETDEDEADNGDDDDGGSGPRVMTDFDD